MIYFVITLMLFIAFGAYQYNRKGKRLRGKRTEHFYAVAASSDEMPKLAPIQRALENLGYDIEIVRKGERIIRDRRMKPDYGEVRLTSLHPKGGGIRIEVRSADDGPEFYDELARYLIVELDKLLDDVRVTHWGMPATTAETIKAELTERPLGLAILPDA